MCWAPLECLAHLWRPSPEKKRLTCTPASSEYFQDTGIKIAVRAPPPATPSLCQRLAWLLAPDHPGHNVAHDASSVKTAPSIVSQCEARVAARRQSARERDESLGPKREAETKRRSEITSAYGRMCKLAPDVLRRQGSGTSTSSAAYAPLQSDIGRPKGHARHRSLDLGSLKNYGAADSTPRSPPVPVPTPNFREPFSPSFAPTSFTARRARHSVHGAPAPLLPAQGNVGRRVAHMLFNFDDQPGVMVTPADTVSDKSTPTGTDSDRAALKTPTTPVSPLPYAAATTFRNPLPRRQMLPADTRVLVPLAPPSPMTPTSSSSGEPRGRSRTRRRRSSVASRELLEDRSRSPVRSEDEREVVYKSLGLAGLPQAKRKRKKRLSSDGRTVS